MKYLYKLIIIGLLLTNINNSFGQAPGYLGRKFSLDIRAGIYPTSTGDLYNGRTYTQAYGLGGAIKPYLGGEIVLGVVSGKRAQLGLKVEYSRNKALYNSNYRPINLSFQHFSVTDTTTGDETTYYLSENIDLSKTPQVFTHLAIGTELRVFLGKVIAPIGSYLQFHYTSVFSSTSGGLLPVEVVEYNEYTKEETVETVNVEMVSNRYQRLGFGYFANYALTNNLGLNVGVEFNFILPSENRYRGSIIESTVNSTNSSQQRVYIKRIYNYGLKIGVTKWF